MAKPLPRIVVVVASLCLCFAAYYYGSHHVVHHTQRLAAIASQQVSTTRRAWTAQQQPKPRLRRPPRQISRLMLIATFSYGPDYSRRALVRDTTLRYGRNYTDSPIDHIFVLGQTNNEPGGLRSVLYSEQAAHHDLMEVECEENCVNTGKTWEMFVKIFKTFDPKERDPDVICQLGWCAEPFTYDFVFKTDGDSIINIPKLVQVLHHINSTDHAYFGSEYRGYMQGEGYGMSWDLVDFIAHDPWSEESRATPVTHPQPYEDEILGNWFWHANLTDVVHKYNYQPEIFQGQTGNLTEQQWLLMHGAKGDAHFWSHFFNLVWYLHGVPNEAPPEIFEGPYTIADPKSQRPAGAVV